MNMGFQPMENAESSGEAPGGVEVGGSSWKNSRKSVFIFFCPEGLDWNNAIP